MTTPSLLDVALRRRAYRAGNFVLSSGEASTEYLDVKGALLHRESQSRIVKDVWGKVGDYGADAVAGVELGGALLAALVSYAMDRHALAIRRGRRGHGTQAVIEGLENLSVHHNHRVWLVEDVITTGETTRYALESLFSVPRLRVVGVVCVVAREMSVLAELRREYPQLARASIQALTTLQRVRDTVVNGHGSSIKDMR